MQKYLRLLNYENACKVIDFINTNDKNDSANITTGGISMQVSQNNWDNVEAFIKSLGVRYEICTETPYKVKQQIIGDLKKAGINNGLNTTILPKYNCSNCSYFIHENPEKLVTKTVGYYAIECTNIVHPLQDCILRGFEGHSEQPSFSQTLNK